jgi:hypothetical protein
MIIVYADRDGLVLELYRGDESGMHEYLNNRIEFFEDWGKMLIKEEDNCYEFADKEGWYCALMIADGWVSEVKNDNYEY